MPVREKGTNGTGTRASRPVSRPCARAERRETAGLSTHRHGIHCTDKLRAGGRWIRTSIPGREAVKPSCETVSKTGADLLGNRRFESISLQQRVCKPPVPLGRGAEPEMPSPLTARNTLIFLVSRACARETKKTQSEGSRLLAVPRARPRRLPLDLRVWNGPSCPETDRCFRSIYPKAQARESCALTFARAETSFSSVDLRPDCGGPQRGSIHVIEVGPRLISA
jgi:hypothetical protein